MTVPTQPEPAEGGRDDEARPAANQGVSAEDPAEGPDDCPAEGSAAG